MQCRWGQLVVVVVIGCGGSDPPKPTFEPSMDLEFRIQMGADPDLNVAFDSTERTSLYVPAGEVLHGERYEVPGYQCLRADGTDWNDLPGGAEQPGESAYFEVLRPLDGTDSQTLVFMPHGDSFEFEESLALEIYKAYPDVAKSFGVDPVSGSRGVEQSTRKGAKRNIVSTSASRSAIALARLGATVVLPGNCWGDAGHGTGQNGNGYYDGRRYGGSFDHDVWTWARAQLAHDPARAVAVGCSGGGHRIAEELIRDPASFQAIVIDSPADNAAEFLSDPEPDLLLQAETLLRTKFAPVMDSFYAGTFGSKEAAAKASLGAELPKGTISAPIYLTYSTNDPAVTLPVVQALADAVGALPAPSMVVVRDEKNHCQLNTDDRMKVATDWLTAVLAP